MVPTGNAFESLEAALLRIAVNPPSSLLDQLQDGRRGVLRCLRRCLGDNTSKINLVIEQVGEVCTSGQDQIAFAFLDALTVEDPQSPLRPVFTLATDALVTATAARAEDPNIWTSDPSDLGSLVLYATRSIAITAV